MKRSSEVRAAVCRSSGSGSGFTLIELLVVMFILSILGLFLVQLLQQGVTVVGTGEAGRELLERGEVAAAAMTDDWKRVAGPMKGTDHGRPISRLVSDYIAPAPSGPVTPGRTAAPGAAPKIDWLPRVRATVVLDRRDEEALHRVALRPKAEAQGGNEQERQEALDKLVAAQSFTSLGEWVFVAWPAGDPEGAYLDLRTGTRLPSEPAAAGASEAADHKPQSVFDEGWLDKPENLLQATRTVVTGVLHIEFRYWSQFTVGPGEPAGKGGPESCWDSARAGLFTGEQPLNRFTLDLPAAAASLADPLDDVFPRRVEILIVVDRPSGDVVCARLAEEVDDSEKELVVDFPERLPFSEATRFLKIGREWIQYTKLEGRRLSGVTRGVRGTATRSHRTGERLHGGRTLMLTVPLTGRDSWNG